jgi:hypothetical protein
MRRLKNIHVRMIPPEGHREDAYTFKAPAGRVYDEASEQQAIDKIIDYLDKKYRYWEFKLVKVGWGRYNFVYAGLRENADGLDDIRKEVRDESSVDGQEQDRDVPEMQ